MDYGKEAQDALVTVREGKLTDKTDAELHNMIKAVRPFQATQYAPQALPTIHAIEFELSQRQARKQHEAVIEESGKIHKAVQKLHKPHWSLTPSFVVIVLTMIFAAIAAWPVIREWLPASQSASKAANFQPQQLNSAPANTTTTQKALIVPPEIQDTNQIVNQSPSVKNPAKIP
jgi:hypothetical protein